MLDEALRNSFRLIWNEEEVVVVMVMVRQSFSFLSLDAVHTKTKI